MSPPRPHPASLVWIAGVALCAAAAAAQDESEPPPPEGDAYTAELGALRWGMRRAEVLRVFELDIEAGFREALTQVRGAVEEDRLRRRIEAAKQRLREGWVEFRGQRTNWDVSYLGPEYTHGNEEAMLQVVEPGATVQDFYFFIRGQLWKWYRAFDRRSFGGLDFEAFGVGLERRYGPAVYRFEPDPDSGDLVNWLEWEDASTRLRAVDESRFFGRFALVYEHRATLARLDDLRQHTIRRGRRSNRRLVDAVTRPVSDPAELGRNADIVDRLTGTDTVRFGPGAGRRPADAQADDDDGDADPDADR